MALKPCRECKAEISTTAKTCPQCGAPVKSGGLGIFGWLAIGLVGLVAIGGLRGGGDTAPSTAGSTSSGSYEPPVEQAEARVQIEDYNWAKDRHFAGRGAIIWNVKVKNESGRNVASVEVEFTTYDKDGKLVSTDSSYVTAIPANDSRASKGYADLYGTEKTATAKIGRVRFAD